jgi:hypothetical protein
MFEDEIFETILSRCIRDEINSEIVKAVKDPTYSPDLSPMILKILKMRRGSKKIGNTSLIENCRESEDV